MSGVTKPKSNMEKASTTQGIGAAASLMCQWLAAVTTKAYKTDVLNQGKICFVPTSHFGFDEHIAHVSSGHRPYTKNPSHMDL